MKISRAGYTYIGAMLASVNPGMAMELLKGRVTIKPCELQSIVAKFGQKKVVRYDRACSENRKILICALRVIFADKLLKLNRAIYTQMGVDKNTYYRISNEVEARYLVDPSFAASVNYLINTIKNEYN